MGEVVVKNVSKRFRIGYEKRENALSRLVSLVSGREPKRDLVALDKVSLSAGDGEFIGVIGRNGSGKSTLLRAMAGIYHIDSGSVKTEGKIILLANLYSGLKERLTMKDNIRLCCAFYGLSPEKIRERLDSIIELSGLEGYSNTKVYQFSEGMKQRLVFSIAMHCDPGILLLDEVFEVGDEEFKRRSASCIEDAVKKGTLVFLVSHDMGLLRGRCNKVVWLDAGRIIRAGGGEVIDEYLRRS